jgi:hypothetical protein
MQSYIDFQVFINHYVHGHIYAYSWAILNLSWGKHRAFGQFSKLMRPAASCLKMGQSRVGPISLRISKCLTLLRTAYSSSPISPHFP